MPKPLELVHTKLGEGPFMSKSPQREGAGPTPLAAGSHIKIFSDLQIFAGAISALLAASPCFPLELSEVLGGYQGSTFGHFR